MMETGLPPTRHDLHFNITRTSNVELLVADLDLGLRFYRR
jgi:hypothetical protein